MNVRHLVCASLGVLLAFSAVSATAADYAVSFTKLTGLTGGSPAQTAVYRADLSGVPISSIQSIAIKDQSGGVGGAGGAFSGFDLDAISLANASYGTAAGVAAATGLSVFNFTPSGTLFLPGTQRAPADPNLFGTNAGLVDNTVATLGAYDGNSTTGVGAFGFFSLGDSGEVIFNLTAAVPTSNLFLYIGEVGDNGEVAAGVIQVSDQPRALVPELPAGVLASIASLLGLAAARLRRR